MIVSDKVKQTALEYLWELESMQLEVCLTYAPEQRHSGHRIRTVCNQNPIWYQKFCGLYASQRKDSLRWRKHKTLIKRWETINALQKLTEGIILGEYGQRLFSFIEREHNNNSKARVAKVYDFAEFKF